MSQNQLHRLAMNFCAQTSTRAAPRSFFFNCFNLAPQATYLKLLISATVYSLRRYIMLPSSRAWAIILRRDLGNGGIAREQNWLKHVLIDIQIVVTKDKDRIWSIV